MHACIEKGCDRPQFGGGFCKYHQFRRYMRGGDLYKPKKPAKAPNKESKKRKKERPRYTEVCDMLTAEIKKQNNGKVYCFFSGYEITAKRPHFHHLKGRTGDYYIDKEWLVPAIDEYHLAYHDHDTEYLLKQKWYTDVFLPNLKMKSIELYNKEIRKREKINKLNPIIFEENDEIF